MLTAGDLAQAMEKGREGDALDLTGILDLSLGYHPGSRVITWKGRGQTLKLGIGQSVYSAHRGCAGVKCLRK